jgi:hypothetical protein
MAGRKPLVLINGDNKRVGSHYCYKIVRSAVHKSMELPNKHIQIWDMVRGKEVCAVTKTRKTITVEFR